MEDREKVSDYAKPLRLPEDCSKNKKNFTQGYFYREIGRYKNAVPSEFQWAAEDKLINKNTYEELKCQLPDSPRSTFLMVFSPDGKKVASTHGNHNVYVTDLTTGKNIQTLSGHPRTPWCIAFHPSSNQILASGCLGGQVRVWDLHGGSEVWTAESQTVIASLAFHPVDRMLVIATYNELHFWDWSQPEPFAKCSTKSGREKVRYVTFDRLGNKLITGIANPVSIPSQWDRISMVNNQPPVTSTTTPTTNINSAPITTTATTQPSNDQRSLSSWYRNFMNRCSQLVSMSCNTPTIDRGTDPMDFMDTRNSGNNAERNNNNNPSPSTSNSHSASSSSPIRFKITRSACRSYRPLSSRERFRIHSSVFKRLSNRTSSSTTSRSNTTTFTTAASTSISQSGVFTTPSIISSPTTSSPSPSSVLRRCAFSLCPAARSWCLTLSPENTSNLFSSRNFSQSASSSGAVTNPTYTSYPDSGIFSTRETNSSFSERSQFPVVRPYRLLFDDIDEVGSTSGRSNYSDREETLTNQPRSGVRSNSSTSFDRMERLRASRQNTTHSSPERSHNRDPALQSLDDTEIEIELHRPTSGFYTRRQESESSNSSSVGADLPLPTELTRNNRSSSILQLRPIDLRNVSPIRRFREDANSDGEWRDSYRRENQTLSQSLMHPRPLPRFQVRSRLMQDHQSQLHLITNRETHGLNLQNNQNLRRQLSFRPGGQYVLSRHSNSPFKPRVPHQIETSTPVSSPRTDKNNPKSIKPEIPSRRSSFSASFSSSTSDIAAAASSSTTNSSSLNSAPSNLSVTNQGSSRQLPEQLNRRLFDRVKMMLRDRIRNSSENASVDSTVNYSRISDEWETDAVHLNDNASISRGLGPRGADPMLSSASEGLDSSTETLLLPTTSVIPENTATVNNDTNLSQTELLDFWESESETVPFSLNSSLSINDILNEQSQPAQESAAQEAGETMEENFETSASNNNTQDNSDLYSPEFSMRQGIELLSLHIENMQRLCLARIEILQLQKIRGMWEDLTKQIRYFHNAIQNRNNRDNSSRPTNSSNSGEDIPILKNLAISNSPVPKPSFSSSIPSETSNNTEISNHRDATESKKRELFRDDKKKNSESEILDNEVKDKKPNLKGRSTLSSTNETEEPQPGPSGVTTTSTSRSVRNSILHLQYRVYRFLRDIIQKTRRRRDSRDLGINNFSGFSRQNHCFRIRNSSRMKFRTHRHNRHLPESNSRSRTLNRELENIWQNWRNEKLISKSEQPTPSTSNADDLNQPSTSKSTSSEACQSCGQRKRPNKEFCRPKRRNISGLCEPDIAGSASKVLKNNVGERSEAPNKKELDEETPSTSYETNSSTTQSPETSTNELLKQMLQTMETMLRFQQEAFRRTKELTADHSAKNHPPSTPSSDDDSDSDQNNSNKQSEMFMKDLLKNFRSTREVIRNSMQDIAQLRAKRLLEFMVKSLNQFFGKNFGHLNQVLDEQIFSLYMLLDLALELTDLLLNHLNARSRNIQRNWNADAAEDINVRSRERINLSSRTSGEAGRIRERNRNFGRSSCHSSETANNEDNIRHRPLANSFSPSHSKLISTRLNSSTATNPNSDRLSNSLLSSYCRRKRRTARMSTSLPIGWYGRGSRTSVHSNNTTLPTSSRTINANSINNNYRSFRIGRRISGNESTRTEFRSSDYEINNNSSNDTNNNSSLNNNRNNNNNYNNDNRNRGRIDDSGDNNSNNISINNNFINYYFPNNSGTNSSDGGNNVIIVTGLNSGSDIANGSIMHGVNRNNNTELNNSGQNSSNTPLSQNPLPPFRSMEVILSRNENGDLSLRDERPIFWIRYGGNNESPGSSNINDPHSRVSSFTVPVVQVNDVPVSDVSLLNQPRHRPQSPVPRVPEDIWRWRALRPRFLHPRYGGPNPFDDQDTNDAPENIHYYRILSTSAVSHLGVYTLDPMIITDAPLSPHHRIQAWDFSKMNIPDISDREANGVVPECKIHNDASVDVSNDGHLLVTLLPSGRLSVTTMLGVYSLDWSSLGQLLYRTSFEQNAVSVSLSPTNRHLLVGLASRPVVRDRTNMAQIFRLEGGRPSPNGGSWQSGRGRLVHMRDLEQTRETNIMSLNCIRWAPGAGQGLVYGTNTGMLKVLR